MKDYKTILEGVVNIINTTEKSDIGFANICTYIGENCPELAESEYEKIRKALIKYFTLSDEHAYYEACGVSYRDIVAWLEKQVPINEEAEKEKNDYVSGQFLYCKGSFNEFKEGESYWIEYIGNDTYIGRSDNILNQKFHITPRQLYTWLDPRHPENQDEQKPIESKSEFKEGDILYNKDSYASDSIFIFKGMSDKTNAYLCYARLYDEKDFSVYSKENWDEGVGIYGGEFYPANHKQKELLFSKMEESGYKWNPDTLTLEKIEKPSTESFDYKHADIPQKDFTSRIDPGFKINLPFEKDYQKLEWPPTIKFDEPDIEEMVEDFWNNKDVIISSHTRGMVEEAYRQGLEDMWKKLKSK